jgi:hypothetical protein
VQARIVAAARGIGWIGDGWRLFRAAPLPWLALVFAYWLVISVVSLVPYAGLVAAAVMVPALSVGFMAAARAAERGARVELGVLFEGFRHNPAPQLALGVVYFLCLCAAIGASSLADGGALARMLLAGGRPDPAEVQPDELGAAAITAALLYAPVMMMFWFSPPLVAWHAAPPAKALFFSAAAFLMNWRAFAAYGAACLAGTLALSAAMLFGAAALGVPPMALLTPVLLVLLPLLFASFYASYRDIFAIEPK